MTLTIGTFLLVCPFLFLAGFVDAIAGGGGLISLPIYMIAGLPPHQSVATNKLSSTCGTALATFKFIKEKLVNFKLAIPSVIAAVGGSSIGAHLSLLLDEKYMTYVLIAVLPVVAFFVLNKKLFNDKGSDEIILNRKTYIIAISSAFIIGIYDGFYGPGTGTFLIIAFTVFAKLSVGTSNAQAKIINLTTNVTSLIIFIANGQVLFSLGLAAAAFNMLGNYVGARLAISKGTKIVKPIIIGVLMLLFLKIIKVI
ncbi:MAG: TSUP family transporter [Clostridiales bacterium]|nr:TSUP family transporter [Clostridiales bacterium]MBS5878255.1 TSUP family transporter [Clostridiales bacterium]MDU0939580.1 TSUP family transporter [Clostridiales bacterium]MDU1041430.1 TSUP family transporter [Clostridiales bacterium]